MSFGGDEFPVLVTLRHHVERVTLDEDQSVGGDIVDGCIVCCHTESGAVDVDCDDEVSIVIVVVVVKILRELFGKCNTVASTSTKGI